jgi:hypothetical protein
LATQVRLEGTRYQNWDGIFQSLYFFEGIEYLQFPIRDPHNFENEVFAADADPMLFINRIVKACWELLRSMRVYIRAAIIHRREDPQMSLLPWDQREFWVKGCEVDLSVFLLFRELLQHFLGLRIYPILDNQHDGIQNIRDIEWMANLLDPRVEGPHYQDGKKLLADLYYFLFEPECHERLSTWWWNQELTYPMVTSYKDATGFNYYADVTLPESPEFSAVDDDLGDALESELENYDLAVRRAIECAGAPVWVDAGGMNAP